MQRFRWRKGIILLAITVLLVALVGCSSKKVEVSPSDNVVKESAAASVSVAPSADVSPITFTTNTMDDKLKGDTPIAKALTEKTGVTLKYELTVGDEAQKADLWLASGDYPELMAMGNSTIKKYAEGGALVPLNDLIDQYGPNIKEKFGK